MAPTTTNQATQTNNQTQTNGNGGGKQPKVLTAIDAISKITKLLDQLSPSDRKRVLAFVNESSENQ